MEINKGKELKELLKKLHSKADKHRIDELKEKAKTLLKNISPTELALIEQEIIEEGISREEIRRLCDIHLEIIKDNLEGINVELKPGHPIHTLMEEHKIILNFIKELELILDSLESAKGFKGIDEEIKKLKHISEHLIEADKHHQREEEVLFPELEKLGIKEPPEIMREEHKDLKAKKASLNKIAIKAEKNSIEFLDFIKEVKEVAGYLIKELPSHIYKEDNVLYPMAIQVIPKNEWETIKKKCDEIGYCCFTPKL